MALDLIGQARAVLTRAGRIEGLRPRRGPAGLPARREGLPQPDAGRAAARRLRLHGAAQRHGRDADEAAVGAPARLFRCRARGHRRQGGQGARYHQQHAADWVVRLGDGTEESRSAHRSGAAPTCGATCPRCSSPTRSTRPRRRRPGAALVRAGGALACGDAHDPRRSALVEPKEAAFRSTGKKGVHEHMGYILAEMQHLQRSFPGGVW